MKKTKTFDLSIIIPAYNEENRIGKTLESCSIYFDKKNIDYELIVVLNGCKDGTKDVVLKYQEKFPKIKYLDIPEAIGKGGAIIEGFIEATGEIIGFTDADQSTSPKMFQKLFQIITKLPSVDCIIGSRNLPGSVVKGRTESRKILTRGFNFGVNFLFRLEIRDTQCGAKLVRKEILKKIIPKLTIANMAFDINLLVDLKSSGGVILEVPIEWTDDLESKVTKPLKTSLAMAFSVIRLRLIYSPFKILYPVLNILSMPIYKLLVGKNQSRIYKKWRNRQPVEEDFLN